MVVDGKFGMFGCCGAENVKRRNQNQSMVNFPQSQQATFPLIVTKPCQTWHRNYVHLITEKIHFVLPGIPETTFRAKFLHTRFPHYALISECSSMTGSFRNTAQF